MTTGDHLRVGSSAIRISFGSIVAYRVLSGGSAAAGGPGLPCGYRVDGRGAGSVTCLGSPGDAMNVLVKAGAGGRRRARRAARRRVCHQPPGPGSRVRAGVHRVRRPGHRRSPDGDPGARRVPGPEPGRSQLRPRPGHLPGGRERAPQGRLAARRGRRGHPAGPADHHRDGPVVRAASAAWSRAGAGSRPGPVDRRPLGRGHAGRLAADRGQRGIHAAAVRARRRAAAAARRRGPDRLGRGAHPFQPGLDRVAAVGPLPGDQLAGRWPGSRWRCCCR